MDFSVYIYAGNLPYNATPEMITGTFSAVAPVKEVKIARNPKGLFMGYAFVRMETAADVAAIVSALHDKEMSGRKLYLTPAEENADLWTRAFGA